MKSLSDTEYIRLNPNSIKDDLDRLHALGYRFGHSGTLSTRRMYQAHLVNDQFLIGGSMGNLVWCSHSETRYKIEVRITELTRNNIKCEYEKLKTLL